VRDMVTKNELIELRYGQNSCSTARKKFGILYIICNSRKLIFYSVNEYHRVY